jgi:catalase
MTDLPITFRESLEVVPESEPADIERIIEILKRSVRMHLEATGRKQRDVHAKAHGSARGEFRILPNLEEELSQGLFARSATYSAAVRFSNSAPWRLADLLPDGRGLALQVEDVTGDRLEPGTTQDFLMANHPVFVARNVKDYRRLEEARLKAGDRPALLPASLLSRAWNPLHWTYRGIAATARVLMRYPRHPASYRYFSMAPIRFGRHVAKYRFVPESSPLSTVFGRPGLFTTQRDAMRLLLAETLRHQELRFAFQIQLQTSFVSMPVEDATVEWPEDESPFRTVAMLVLPQQDIEEATESADGEQRAYSVWNALVEHRPLGGINRVRRQAYAVSAAFRNG